MPSGSQYRGHCPLPDHDDRRPSFVVSPERQVFYCHGCKQGGDVIELYRHLFGLSFPDAVHQLIRLAGNPPEASRADCPKQIQEPRKRPICLDQGHLDLLTQAHAAYQRAARHSTAFRDYLAQRGVRPELAQALLGFAPPSSDFLRQQLHQPDRQRMLDTGLLDHRAGRDVERMRNGIIFTTTDLELHPQGFVCRRLTGSPRYLNSSFPKAIFPYGLGEAAPTIRDSGEVILVEGPFDWLALVDAGFPNTLALLGSGVSKETAAILRALGAHRVRLMFDGDQAGITAAEQARVDLLGVGLEAEAVALPAGHDPASLWKTYRNTRTSATTAHACTGS